MKKMATAAQTARQNNISSQRSANFRLTKRRCPVVARSGSTSFMTSFACCLMTVYEKPSVERVPVKTILGPDGNLRNVRPIDANLPGFLIVPHGARLCCEWEQYVSHLQHSWFFLRKTTQYYRTAMSQQWKDTGIVASFHSAQAVR
ncbi:hypothetical protein PY650_10230 [Rhizobium calliandrae]|uniref:Uncharacterized protein n=1 Tax=Rhizobium calliandrae TaxID=1312182 RepID=A0ABT7KBP5_9HYPH|nr:hypothetical protein [Rhizobium calliandrae]MDL2406036.1 hypothetical protein [Rhizobium calliandrae]